MFRCSIIHRATHAFVLTVAALCLTTAAGAQEPVVQHRPYLDNRFLHYGFFIGFNAMDMEVRNNGFVDPTTGEQWYADVDNYQPGFSVGILGEVRLSKYLGLRVQPTIHFGQKHVYYHEQLSGRDSTQNIKSTLLSVPIGLKIAAPRYNNFRPYAVVDVAPTVDMTSRKQTALQTQQLDCYVELGLGCDFYLPYFKFIPELKFCFGLRDCIVHDRKDLTEPALQRFTRSVDRGASRMIVLSFYFE